MVKSPPLVPVNSTIWGIEYSVHECPRNHKDDIAAIFPGLNLDGMLVIPTCQHASMDLVQWGEDTDQEKDRLLEQFMAFARIVVDYLSSLGHWADYIDPCSGLPMVHRASGSVYGEVEGLVSLLGYRTQNAGCCKIVLHPRWGSSVYPASIFAKAPVGDVQTAILRAEELLAEQGGCVLIK